MIRFFAGHPTAANILMLVLLLVGVLALPNLRRETFADFSPKEVEVRVLYPGAAAEDVEEAVCRRIEDALDGVNFVEEVRAEAREGIATVVVELQRSGNFQVFLDDVKTEVEAIDDLPGLAERPIVRQLGRTDPVVSLAVTGDVPVPHLKAYVERVKDRLLQVPGISLVDVQGFSDHHLRVELSQEALLRHGLTVARVATAVSRQSVDLPVGSLLTSERDLLLRFDEQRRTPAELAALIVLASEEGAEIRLGDVATITDRFELDEEKILFNGKRAGMLQVHKAKTEDALDVMDAVRSFLTAERARTPAGIELTLTRDTASIVRDRLALIVTNGWQGLILVFLTLGLFFSLRFSFWVSMGLPVAFLGGLYLMELSGHSLNMITMVGLLLAIGLLMDDAIVIAENVAAHLGRGATPLTAAVEGVSEVKHGVLSSFLTTVCVFGPLAFLEGRIGIVLRVMPIVLLLVMTVSMIEAFLILPRHLAHAGLPPREGRLRRAFDAAIAWVREVALGRSVDLVVRWRYLAAGGVLLVFLVSAGQVAGGRLKFQAFPAIDGDTLEARLLLPQGTPLARTEALVTRLTAALDDVDRELRPHQPGGVALVRNVEVRFAQNLDAHERGPHVATVSADLLPAEERNARIAEIEGRWREHMGAAPDVLSLTFTEPSFAPSGIPIEIRLQGEDLVRVKAAAMDMRQWLSGMPGVFDLTDDLRPGRPEVRLRLREGATALGLDALAIATDLRSHYYGQTAAEIQVGSESYEIDLRLREAERSSLGSLDTHLIALADGRQIPLLEVVRLQHGRGWARIARIDGRRTGTVQGDVDTRVANTAEILRSLRTEFMPGFEARFPDIAVSFEGEAKEGRTTGASLQLAFALGLAGIFFILSYQFRSYLEPLVVMMAIPLSAVGVIWGHIFLGLDLTLPSLVGFVSLSGIVVNDSILLVSFVTKSRASGLDVAQAACAASRQRFRAVLLTSLTTIAGLLPLLSEGSLQAQILIPLAASVVFGLLASTFLVLVVIPALYTILADFGLVRTVEVAASAGDVAPLRSEPHQP